MANGDEFTGPQHPAADRMIAWQLKPFPEELKNRVVARAKLIGRTTPAMVEDVISDWLDAEEAYEAANHEGDSK